MARGHRGRPRGAGRGGRGGFSKRGGRGGRGGRGNSGGFKSGKAKGNSNNHNDDGTDNQDINYQRQFNQLMDLDVDVHTPVFNSMKALSRRPGKKPRDKDNFSFYKAVDYTTQHLDDTMSKPLRRYHIEFVKASEVYDPSADLIKKLSEIELKTELMVVEDIVIPEEKAVDEELVEEIAEMVVETTDTPEVIEEELTKIEVPKEDVELIDDEIEMRGELEVKKVNTLAVEEFEAEEGDEVYELIDVDSDDEEVEGNQVLAIDSDAESQVEVRVGKFVAEPEIDSDGDMFISLPQTSRRSKKLDFIREKEMEYDDYKLDNQGLDDDEEEGDDYYKESIRDYISNVMKNTLRRNSDSEFESDSDEYDDDDDDFEEEVEVILDSGALDQRELQSPFEVQRDDESDDPEFGFLPEDYEAFDVSRISVCGVRKSANEVLYDTTSTLFFGDSESRWIEREEFIDLAVENGLPEHRIPSFMKFMLNEIEDDYDESEEESEDSGLEFITDGDDSESDSEMGIDEDDIKHMTAFVNSRQFDPLEVNTKSLKTKGKGKKSELLLDDDLEMRQELMNQFLFRNSSKRDKRKAKHDDRKAMEELDSNLLTKYPYEMWIKEIVLEFKSFYKDHDRVALRFPPLDPHGIKTLNKIADHYHMAHRKLGSGKQTFVVVIKNKKTYNSSPDYVRVERLIKQRPIFHRTDTKKPKDVAEKEKNLKMRNKGKSSSAGQYFEGALVAQDAPEISHDNIGRKLLEKMGWQKGNSLGVGNDGIIEPIQAKIKKNKAGINLSINNDTIH